MSSGRSRRWPALLALVLLVIVAGWVGIWFHLAAQFQENVARWAMQRRAEGWAVSWRTLSVEGFPFAWNARIADPRAARTGRAPHWFWRGPELAVRYRPWSPRTVEIVAPGRHTIGGDADLPESAVTVEAAFAQGQLSLADDGRLQDLFVAVDGATARWRADESVHVERLRAKLSEPPDPVQQTESHRRPTIRLEVELTGLRLPAGTRPVLGHAVGRATLHATLLGQLPAAPLPEALTLWRDDGGTVEVTTLGLGWGPLAVEADGTIALDDGLQPMAALSARVSGYAETIDAMVRGRLMQPRHAFFAKLALGALARTPEGGGRPEIAVPLTIQDRQLYVGPVALMVLPRIDWPAN